MGRSLGPGRGAGCLTHAHSLRRPWCASVGWTGEGQGGEPVLSSMDVFPGAVLAAVLRPLGGPTGFCADIWATLETSTQPAVSRSLSPGPRISGQKQTRVFGASQWVGGLPPSGLALPGLPGFGARHGGQAWLSLFP